MSDTTKRYILSSVTTFLATFFTVIGIMMTSGMPIAWTSAGIAGIVLAAARAGVKAVVEGFAGAHADR